MIGRLVAMEQLMERKLAWEIEILGDTQFSATLFTTNPTQLDLGLNPSRI
jgi:hypothetical protein